MTQWIVPELWQWAEYSCPWSYIAAVRLYHVYPEYDGRPMCGYGLPPRSDGR